MDTLTYDQLRKLTDVLVSVCNISFTGTARFRCKALSDIYVSTPTETAKQANYYNKMNKEIVWSFRDSRDLFFKLSQFEADRCIRTFPKGHAGFDRARIAVKFKEGEEKTAFFFKTGRRSISLVAHDECTGTEGDPYNLVITIEGLADPQVVEQKLGMAKDDVHRIVELKHAA